VDSGRIKHVGLLLLVAVTFLSRSVSAQDGFEGSPNLEPIEDSFIEQYRTTSEMIYRQVDGRVWITPSGSVVDGRGFPRLFVDIFGPPLNSHFAKTAVTYDYSVKSKHHPWATAQKMVYEAMRIEGATQAEANLTFMLLRATGTRWATQGPSNCFSRCHGPNAKLEWRPVVKDEDVIGLVDWARNELLSLDEIDSRVADVILDEGPHSSIGIR